jgi:hypothetical protein
LGHMRKALAQANMPAGSAVGRLAVLMPDEDLCRTIL